MKTAKEKHSLIFYPIFNKVQKLRCCTQITGAVYRSSVYNVCGDSLPAEQSILNGGRLEVAAAPLSYGCCKSLLHCTLNPVGVSI